MFKVYVKRLRGISGKKRARLDNVEHCSPIRSRDSNWLNILMVIKSEYAPGLRPDCAIYREINFAAVSILTELFDGVYGAVFEAAESQWEVSSSQMYDIIVKVISHEYRMFNCHAMCNSL